MVNSLLFIVHDLLYCVKNGEFTTEERNYIIEVTMKAVNLIMELNKR